MSYSRWGGSRWYTYWLAMESAVRSDQVFVVLDIDGDSESLEGAPVITEYAYGVIKANPLGVARQHAAQLGTASEAEIRELATYMGEWCDDVERAFPVEATR